MSPIQFTRPADTTGVAITDRAESTQLVVETASSVSPTTDAGTEQFTHPVDAAVCVTVTEVTLNQPSDVTVRTPDGEHCHTVTEHTTYECSLSAALIELDPAIKLYLHVTNPPHITTDDTTTTITFDAPTAVTIGARSHHRSPSTTITVPPDPDAFLDVVDRLGGAITEFSPERSWPTLRGHPPAIEIGDELDVPSEYAPPDTGVTLVVPPTYEALYAVAPLSYYLGADVVAADTTEQPRLETDTGGTYSLLTEGDIATTAVRILQRVFVGDCVTRTEGLYEFPVRARHVLDDRLTDHGCDIDFAALYDQSVAAQVDTYMTVPWDAVADLVPQWSLCAHLPSTAAHATALPAIIDELGVVNPTTGTTLDADAAWSYIVRQAMATHGGDALTRSVGTGVLIDDEFVAVDTDVIDAHEHVWFGDAIPVNASQATLDTYRPLPDTEPETASVSVAVVCQDPEAMEWESSIVAEAYTRDSLLDVTYHTGVTVDEFRDILQSEAEFLHYIGHIEDDGFVCTDGCLDVADLRSVSVETFFLNACSSYAQGRALLEAGSRAGVVTLTDVVNENAARTGAMTASFLRNGFRFRDAMTLADRETGLGEAYLLLGRGATTIGQSECPYPLVYTLRESRGDEYLVDVDAFGCPGYELGALTSNHNADDYTLLGNTQTVTAPVEDMEEELENPAYPVITADGIQVSCDDTGI